MYETPVRRDNDRSYGAESELNSPFILSMQNRSYGEQYSNIYFARLIKKRPKVYSQAKRAWGGLVKDGVEAKYSLKVLDVGNHELSWVVGTVYREMKYKPSLLAEITASVSTNSAIAC